MSKKSIIFFHVPKTGGTTCINIFKKEIKSDKTFTVNVHNTDKDIKKLLSSGIKYDIIMGHNILNIHEKLKYETEYVSFVRNPIDHFLSTFFYIKRSQHNRYNRYIKNMTLEQFLDSDLMIQDFDNYQTRVFGGYYEQNVTLSDTYNFDKNGEKYYNNAIKNIQNIQNIYLFEKFDDALKDIQQKFNLSKGMLNYEKKNSTSNRMSVDDLSDELKDKITNKIKYDIMLYDFIKKQNEIK